MYRILIVETGEYLYRKGMVGWASLYTPAEINDEWFFIIYEAETKEEAKTMLFSGDRFRFYPGMNLISPKDFPELFEIVEIP